jgi:hypothetical protein
MTTISFVIYLFDKLIYNIPLLKKISFSILAIIFIIHGIGLLRSLGSINLHLALSHHVGTPQKRNEINYHQPLKQ